MVGNTNSPCWLAVWISLPPAWLFAELPVDLCASKTNGLTIPLENPLPMLKPAGTRERKNKWQGRDGFSTFIPPAGAVSEVVQELGLQVPLHSHL